MSRKSRYSAEFKQDAVMRMGQGGKTVTALAKQLGIRRKFLYFWRDQLRLAARRHWSEAREGRQGASRKLFQARQPVRPNCGSRNWSGC